MSDSRDLMPTTFDAGKSDASSEPRPSGAAHWATSAVRTTLRSAGSATRSGSRIVGDLARDLAPRIPVRDLETLRAHHHGLEGEALADALVEAAATTAGALGAAGGAAAARTALRRNPLVLATQMLAEPLAVAAVEIKLLAELHEVYDVQVAGSGAARARHFAAAWASARGVNPLDPGSASAGLGSGIKGQLGGRIATRLSSRFVKTGPLLAGAAAGGLVNGKGTRDFAAAARAELRRARAER